EELFGCIPLIGGVFYGVYGFTL
ncbi:MAG: hypothetical protein RLY97_190, partial [Pseudomonadota bacterium]